MSETNLFEDFSLPSYEEWHSIVEGDLKGADFQKKLVWRTLEGIDVQPLYTARDTAQLQHTQFVPGEAPYVRGGKQLAPSSQGLTLSQELVIPDPARANEALKKGIERGQTGVEIIPYDGEKGVLIQDYEDFTELLAGIRLEEVQIHIHGGKNAPAYYSLFKRYIAENSIDASTLHGSFGFDLTPAIFSSCGLHGNLDVYRDTLKELILDCKQSFPNCRAVEMGSEVFHRGGANCVQELAYTFAKAVEGIHNLTEGGIEIDDACASLRFTLPVGTNYFFEIAKLRTARMLWAKIAKSFGAESPAALRMHIHAKTSPVTETLFDPYVNMLRGTTQTMAAMIGGADSVSVAPFDSALGIPTDFSLRIARNTAIILQEESYLGKVADPAAGSYYIEQLTDTLAREVWKEFQDIEAQGGFMQCAGNGTIQDRIAETARARRSRVSQRKDSIIGTNVYPNLAEIPIKKDDPTKEERKAWIEERTAAKRKNRNAEIDKALSGIDSGASLLGAIQKACAEGALVQEVSEHAFGKEQTTKVAPIPPYRAADVFETLRLAVERADSKPKAFLTTLGPVFWRRARASFASGFLGTAGLDVQDNLGFESGAKAVEAVKDADPEIVVLCSDDESYLPLTKEMLPALKEWKPGIITIVAGYPKDVADELKQLGIDEFIHVKADAGEVMRRLLEKLGIDAKEVQS
ncbi:MAG: hypothetical protein CL946_11325 [Ectothiorhodospiraceae bacterium]|nr:hypothetical protein [Ectothiorhodospiraceae bacterium]